MLHETGLQRGGSDVWLGPALAQLKGWGVLAQVYIIEANPRASRTVPFVAKAVGHPLAKYASLLMSGMTLPELGFTQEPKLTHVAVKEAVLPFEKFPGPLPRLPSPSLPWPNPTLLDSQCFAG